MKTSELIDALAAGAGPAPRAVVARRIASAVLIGLAISAAAATAALGVAPLAARLGAALWVKLVYAASLGLAGTWLAARLARPAARSGAAQAAVAATLVAMAAAGLASVATAPAGVRAAEVLGHSWATCPWGILVLALPTLAGTLWALRGLAPTRLDAAGAAAGLVAGAVGAASYALACAEEATAFVALWYTLGIGLSALLGAVAGPRLLRW